MTNEKVTKEQQLAEWLKKWKIEVVERWSKYFDELLTDNTFLFILSQWYQFNLREQDQRQRRINDIINKQDSILGHLDEYNSQRCYYYSDIIHDIFTNKEENK